MSVSHPNSFIYWGIPHTGNDVISAALTRHYGLEKSEPNIKPDQIIIPKDCRNYTIVTSIRDPFSRFVSYWEQFKNQKADKSDEDWRLKIQSLIDEHPNDFARFAHFIFEESDFAEVATPSQMSFLKHYCAHYYVKYESLNGDFSNLPFVGEQVKIGLRSNSGHWKKLYTPKLQRLVAAHWEGDFSRLGYPMEISQTRS